MVDLGKSRVQRTRPQSGALVAVVVVVRCEDDRTKRRVMTQNVHFSLHHLLRDIWTRLAPPGVPHGSSLCGGLSCARSRLSGAVMDRGYSESSWRETDRSYDHPHQK